MHNTPIREKCPHCAYPICSPEDPGATFPTMDEMKAAHLAKALEISGGHVGEAAQLLHISTKGAYNLAEKYGLRRTRRTIRRARAHEKSVPAPAQPRL